MNAWPKSIGAITLFVEDPQRSKSYYQRVFDVAAIYEDEDATAFRFDNMIVNLLRFSAARGLIGPGAVAAPQTGSSFQLTIWVEDTDAVCSDLATRGVELLNGPDGPRMGRPHRLLHRPRRPRLGGCAAAARARRVVAPGPRRRVGRQTA